MIEHVTVALIRPDKRILLQLRDHNAPTCPDTWCIPGGALEEGEDALAAAQREVKEEFDIVISPDQCKYVVPYTNFTCDKNSLYACRVDDVIPRLREGKAFSWVTIGELRDLQLGFSQNTLIAPLANSIHAMF